MKYQNSKTRVCAALTLVEMVIAMAIMVIVSAALLPQFRGILNSWDSKAAAAETLQNARVLIDHLNRNLTKAARITAVSDFTETIGFIEFEDNDGDTLRYDVDANSYVQFGLVGSLSELAGPVSQLQFTCYDVQDLDTPITNVDNIRSVKVEITLTNPAELGQDETFITQAYLRTNANLGTQELVGWWKLDESSGLTAVDSSGNGNDGTLTNMFGDEWTTGQIGGALELHGSGDYVNCGNDSSLQPTMITACMWVKANAQGSYKYLLSKGDRYAFYTYSSRGLRFYIRTASGYKFSPDAGSSVWDGQWHHIAATYDKNYIRLYVDGAEIGSGTAQTQDISYNTANLYIGEYAGGGNYYFTGTIDDVRIYERALTDDEISALADTLRYREFTEAKATFEATSLTISTPTGTSEGDLLIAAVATDGDTKSSLAPPGGEGWTEIDIDDRSGEVTLGAWWKLADASESPSHQFTWSGDEQAYGWIMRFTGHHPDDPINDWAKDKETSSTPTSPEVTTTVDDCLILRLGAFDDDDITLDDPGLSGHTAITMDTSGSGSLMVGWWKLDENSGTTAADSSGRGNDGTLTNMDGDEWTTGVCGNALEFYGGGDYVNCGNDSSLQPLVITACMWAKANAQGSYKYLLSKGDRYAFYTYSSGGLRFYIHTASGYKWSPDAGSGVWDGQWHHIAATYDKNYIRLYVDGAEIGSGTAQTQDISYNTANLYIGEYAGGGNYYFTGTIDDVRIYNSAWSADEITELAECGGGGGGDPVDPVSGGAGYFLQPDSGGSGTSDFSLTASEESVTLTIAIAPNPESGGGGGGEIRP